jgi:hypothetical protein
VPWHRRLLLITLAALVLGLPLLRVPDPLHAQAVCTLSPSFQALHDQIPDLVGDCLEVEHLNPQSGLIEQHTSCGVLMLRPADGLTGFTDGTTL